MSPPSPKKKKGRFPVRFVALLGGTLVLVLALSLINLSPDLGYLDVRIASGPELANYHAIVEKLKEAAAEQDGTIKNLATKGTVDNIERLIAEKDDCDLHYALVQDGVPAPKGHGLELIARLPKSESVFILGKTASSLRQFKDMQGLRMGVGPKGSGIDYLARGIFESSELAPLALRLSNHPVGTQLQMLNEGTLDLAVFVLDEDATLVRDAVRNGMQMASFAHLDIIARKFNFIAHGRIGAGQYDPINVIPATDHRVLRVDTLLVSNGCASRSETIAMLTLLRQEYPNIIAHNLSTGGSGYFAMSSDAQDYLANGGPEWADSHVPWLVDIMPIDNWFYVVMAISILFNLMTSTHKFRLWRVDANRERAQQVFREVLGTTITPREIYDLEPNEEHRKADNIAKLDTALKELDLLRERCRVQENSPLVPMGQELAYRYQEEQMEIMLSAVRDFRRRIDEAGGAIADSETDSKTEGESKA